MKQYSDTARRLVLATIAKYPLQRECVCHSALKSAIATNLKELPDNLIREQLRTEGRQKQRIFRKNLPPEILDGDMAGLKELPEIKD